MKECNNIYIYYNQRSWRLGTQIVWERVLPYAVPMSFIRNVVLYIVYCHCIVNKERYAVIECPLLDFLMPDVRCRRSAVVCTMLVSTIGCPMKHGSTSITMDTRHCRLQNESRYNIL